MQFDNFEVQSLACAKFGVCDDVQNDSCSHGRGRFIYTSAGQILLHCAASSILPVTYAPKLTWLEFVDGQVNLGL